MSYKWGHPVATLPVTNGTIRCHTRRMTEILRITYHLRPSPFPPRVRRAPPRNAAQRPSPLPPATGPYSAATTQQRAHGVDGT
eukprot:1879649-Pleurochrysis_carterae.AAC.1